MENKFVEYGAFLIKPDAVALGQQSHILRDINDYGFHIEDVRDLGKLKNRHLRGVWAGNTFPDRVWDAMEKRNHLEITLGVIVSPNGLGDINIHREVNSYKKVLRPKYGALTKAEAMRRSSNEDNLAYWKGATRVHGAGDIQEFKWLVQTLYTGRDMDGLRISNEQLFQYFSQII